MDYRGIDPRMLIAGAGSGDREAFAELYRRYRIAVFAFLMRRVRNRVLAEDLTSETFARALGAVERYAETGRDPGAWLVTIARNLVFDDAKSSWRQRVHTTGEPAALDRCDPRDSPESEALAAERRATIVFALARLSLSQERCLRLRYLHGLSLTETATELGRGIGATKALQRRASRELAGLLGSQA
ncbi:RNA polymerase sigma factor [Longispora fulva]|uniref:RNA polymerase sigma-70 factor (ECF subfamily) n=1 Tax=Longispora fulva TaxID=619741 RepID=A0A8J7GH72_9ACTN|nr:sigma-70 family RNA polymerase sigma factor [Longispora fulva]MBG6137470.1 RNA polymerase sigma-70 factor (ECF subfamily) [Longispora fulva]GIG61175.1 RNA polymerase sigma factor [Longispora fulva]